MNNEMFKESLSALNMNKKEFAKKIGVAHQTVLGWTNQGYPKWVKGYLKLLLENSNCVQSYTFNNNTFKEKLIEIGINKKEFAEKFNLSQSAVNNWSSKPIPSWVEVALDMMLELKSLTNTQDSIHSFNTDDYTLTMSFTKKTLH